MKTDSTIRAQEPTESSTKTPLLDVYHRPLRDIRISLTDRCNFRCQYCMPKEVFGPTFQFHKREELLTDEEIVRLVRIFRACGVVKVRLTGGEPLLRPNLEGIISEISRIPGIEDISMTTNGSLLDAQRAKALNEAGLERITISLDALDNNIFMAMNDVQFPVHRVLNAIQSALTAGLSPVKVNMVVRKGVNDDAVLEMAQYFRGSGCTLRFIEFMDVGNTNRWKLDEVVSSRTILEQIHARWPVEPLSPNYRGEVATRYRYTDGRGEIGFISSVTGAFCSDCTRSRISSDGKMYTCLFGTQGFDIRAMLRNPDLNDEDIAVQIGSIWGSRRDRYSEIRSEIKSSTPKIEMSQIGG